MVLELNTADYREIVENAVAGIFRTTAEGQLIMANLALASMLGFASPEELIRARTELPQTQFVQPWLPAESRELLEAQGWVCGFEYEAYRKDGTKIWISASVRTLKDENGMVLGYEGIAEDISNRRRAEALGELMSPKIARGQEARELTGMLAREQAASRETEILRDANIALTQNLSLDTILEAFLDYLNILVPYDSANVMLLDGDSKFVVSALRRYEGFQDVEITRALVFDGQANQLLRRICLTKQSVLVSDTRHDPNWQSVRGAEHVRNWLGVPLLAAGKVIGLYSVDKAEPDFFNAEHARLAETLAARAASAIRNAQLFQQSQQYVAELEQRISERKRAETALRESEERYRELFENAKDAIYVHNLEGTYISVNRGAERLSGRPREEILGHNFAEFIPRKHIGRVREQLCAKLAEKGETTYELEVIGKDGRWVPVEVSSRLIYENGMAVGVQGTARDITERKWAQEALQMFSRRLIQAQEEERGRIARDLHDQIGQVLTVVKMNLHTVLQLRHTPEASPYIKDSMDVVDEALRLVRDLSVDLRPPLLDDLGLVTALRWYVDRYAQRTGVRADVFVELPDHEERFAPDLETTCFRVVQEALTNVVRHARAKRVLVQLTRDRSDLLLAVKDDGIGFDLKALQKRSPRAATLGLLGMQERAHVVGGTIEIASVLSKGTEVRLRIPIRARS